LFIIRLKYVTDGHIFGIVCATNQISWKLKPVFGTFVPRMTRKEGSSEPLKKKNYINKHKINAHSES
jgi:hypothetical protein